MSTAKSYPPGAYQCPACYLAFDDYAAYDAHRRITHGRDEHNVLVAGSAYQPTPTIEARITQLESQFAAMLAELALTKAALLHCQSLLGTSHEQLAILQDAAEKASEP